MVDINSTGYAKLARLRQIAAAALIANPYSQPVMTNPPVISCTTTSNSAFAPRVDMASGGILNPAAMSRINFYGGVPTIKSGAYVAMPVTGGYPSMTGNAGLGDDRTMWSHAFEIMTDAAAIEFWIYAHSGRKVMFQVDGVYVDKVGTPGAQASSLDNIYTLTFSGRAHRRIRVMIPTVPSTGPGYLKAIRLDSALSSFWKPSLTDVIRVGWAGDSYSEGTNGAASIYPIPNAAWPVLACELLGFRDCRQLAVGSTGYISSNGGTFSKLRDQMTRYWPPSAPYDLLVFAGGYNDASNTSAAITAEVLFDLQQARSMYPGVPMVVHGCQAGAAGPNATQIACDAAIGAAVTAFNDPLCKFMTVSNDNPVWLNGNGKIGATTGVGNSDIYVDPDGIHPSLAGAEYLAYRSATAIRAAIASMLS